MTQETKALEYLANQLASRGLGKDEIRRQLNQASVLATLEGVSEVVGSRATPTPLYRITYNTTTNSLDFNFLEGKGKVPTSGSIDVDIGDVVITSLLSDRTPLLFEGITGTGKTYTLEQVLKAVYSPDNRRSLRLNPNMSNVLQPYIEGSIDGGVLRIKINRDAAREIAALFIDEQNRGDTNAVLGLLDNQVNLATGERAELGLLIPQLDLQGKVAQVYFDENRVKPIAVFSAQNPSSAEYSGARSTDGAVGNRQVRVNYPNMALNSGAATLNMTTRDNDHHAQFINSYVDRLSKYLKVDKEALLRILSPQGISEDEQIRSNSEYLSLHAFSFDPGNSRNPFLKSAVEGSDHIVMLTGGDGLAKNFEQELEVAKDWTDVLQKYRVNFQYNGALDTASQVIARIDAVRGAFKEPLIERDKTKATKIADSLALIAWYKQAYKNARERGTSPFEEFKGLQSPLTIRDIAGAYAIVLNDKIQSRNGVSPVSVINQAFTDYVNILERFGTDVFKKQTRFDLTDPNMGIRYLASYLAVNSVKNAAKLTPDEYAAKMIDEVNKASGLIRALDDGIDTRKLLIVRVNADLASLAGFIHQYRREIAENLNAVPKSDRVLPRYNSLTDVVRQARGDVKINYTLPRVERTFGI